MKRYIFIILLILSLSAGGCDQLESVSPSKRQKTNEPVSSIDQVESLEFAKLILKPKRHKLDVSKDPFKPLITNETPPLQEVKGVESLEGLKFVGVIRMNDEYLVLLKTNSEKGVFKLRDKIKNYIIEDIQPDRVKLSNGVRSVILKRGAEK